MRGQRLFVRPIEPDDREALARFLEPRGAGPVPACGLLGKVVGDLVAVLSVEFAGAAARIDRLVVAEPLRRKRIGRFMLDELAALCRRLAIERIVVSEPGEASEFLRRVGFQEEDGLWVRNVSPS